MIDYLEFAAFHTTECEHGLDSACRLRVCLDDIHLYDSILYAASMVGGMFYESAD